MALVKVNDYHELIKDNCKLVDSAILLVFGYKIDGGVDHNKTNFQNTCFYIAGAILLRSNQYFICRGCPGNLYLNT